MMNWYRISEILSSFIEAGLCYGFTGLFLPSRIRARMPSILLSLTLAASVQVMDAFHLNPLLSALWFVFFICVTTVALFRTDLFYAVSLVSFYILCLYIINYFCMSVMGVIAGNRQFASFIINQLSVLRCVYLAADKALLVLFYLLVRKFFKEKLPDSHNLHILSLVSLLGILGVIFLSLITLQDISVITVFSWGLCLIMLLCFFFLLLLHANYMKEKEMRGILELRDEMVKQEYDMVKQLQTEQQTLSHDMKNHLLILDSMIKEERLEEAGNYISRLREPLERLSPSVWTGTPTLDVLLNHTKGRCARSDINFTVQADALDLRPMEDQDICSLFANLLDNAREAAGSMPAGRRWVHVRIRRIKSMIFIDISNSSPGDMARRHGKPVSCKKDGRLHGFGLNSASAAVEKYGGQFVYGYEGGVFTASVSFLGGFGIP